MPALKKTSLPAGYTALRPERLAMGEAYDCTVVSIALTTGIPYSTVHAAMTAAGRRPGKRAADTIWKEALNVLGFEARQWSATKMIAMVQSYPKKGIAGITTHQPRRFPNQWANTGRLILRSRGHVSACIYGEVQDWAINSSKQVFEVYEIVKKGS